MTVSDRTLLDLDPTVRQLKALLGGVTDDVLASPTPCPDWTVGDLLDHVIGLTWAFTQAAQKTTGAPGTSTPPPKPSAEHLSPLWRDRLPGQLDALAQAWRDPAAWDGMAEAGGVTMPAGVMAVVALNEVTMHGWDLARATGQPFEADPRGLEAIIALMSQGSDEGVPGMFGPVVRVGPDAPLLDRAVGLSGRDPACKP
jgi:uncharacterized protein (TIGR03086 family)